MITPNDDLAWIKSSFSGANGNCVELATTDQEILVRNSKRPDEPSIRFTPAEMAAFIAGCKAGEFDHITAAD